MTTKKKLITSVAIAVSLVVIAQVAFTKLGDFDIVAGIVLLPGGAINLLWHGVHGNWGMLGDFITVGVSSAVWSIVAFAFLTLLDPATQKKKEPNLK